MKKIYLLLLTIFSAFLMNAQTTVTIGAGATNATGGTNGNPIYRSSATSAFNFSQSVHLLLPGDLTTAGITGAVNLTKIAFFKNDANTLATGRTATMKIYLKNSSNTALNNANTFSTWVTGATLVYNNAVFAPANFPAAAGFVNFDFTATPFTYTGGALEIAVDWGINGTAASPTTGAFSWTYDATTAIQNCGTSNSAAISTALSITNLRRYRTQLTYVAAPVCSGTPNGGTAISSSSTVCSGSNVNLSLSGSTSGVAGLTYQWQSSPAAANTFTNITGAISSTYTAIVSANTDYQCIVGCTPSGLSATSTPVTVNTVICLPNFTTTYTPSITYNSIVATGTSATWQSATSGDDNTTTNITLPFAFQFKGTYYTVVNACTNGWLGFGGTSINSWTNTLGSSTNGPTALLAPFWEDMVVTGNVVAALPSAFKYLTTGTAPNRVFTAEWIGNEIFSYPGPNLNFQIKLYETSNKIEYIYGTMEGFNGTLNLSYSYSIGLRASATDYISLQNQNSNFFSATVANDALLITPECNSMYTFDQNATLSTGTAPVAAPPANDNPAGAINIIVNPSPCTSYCGTYFQTAGATATTSIPVCTATTAGTPDDDVWFTFTATNAAQNISVFGAAGYDAVVQAFSDAGITSIGCVNGTLTSLTESLALTGLTVGNVYYIRIYHAAIGNGTTSQISICISAPPPPPSNDDPCGAVVLTASATCVPYVDNATNSTTSVIAATTTTQASAGHSIAAPTCTGAGANVSDVWFKFITTADRHAITVTPVTGFDVAIEAFTVTTATSCGAANLTLTSVGCINAASTGAAENVTLSGVTGTEWYFRIYRHPSGISGAPVSNSQFSICVFSPTPVCVTNSSPANLATAVAVLPTLTFSRPNYASSYDVYLGASAATATLNGTVADPGTGTTVSYSLTTALAPSTTYFWYVVPKNSTGAATGCSTANATSFTTSNVTPPGCVTNIAPADMATGINAPVTLSWNAEATATSYNIFAGTVNPPTTTIATAVTGTTYSWTGATTSTLYYWYVVPVNTGGTATGCNTNVTSFTTSAICTPSTSNGGTSGDGLTDFVLNGEGATAISVLAAAPIASPGYIDLTATTTVDLAAGKAYAGNFKVQDGSDNLSIWIDYNNNGGFEANEMVLNNLKPLAGSTTSPYSVLISPTATLGTHKMRVRDIFNTAPTAPVTACTAYTFGEGKDFTVNIVASGAAYSVSSVGAAACATIAKTTIDAASNNNNSQIPLLDATGAIVAQLNANGNDLGTVTTSVYRNTSAVRQAGASYYLDRNLSITPATQPISGNVGVRLYYSAAEFAALQAVDPSVLVTNMTVAKTPALCSNAFSGVTTVLSHAGDGLLGTDYYLDVLTPSFSSFFLKAPAAVLPVSLEFFTGTKQATGNNLDWRITCTSSPSVTLTVERSADGNGFKAISQQTATATRCLQAFNYIDATPLSGKNFYRLKITTVDGTFRYSTIVVLLNKDKGFELISLAPNPVLNDATLTLTSVKAGKINLAIKDIAGKAVSNQSVNVIAGNNPINVNFATLGAGTYSITAINAEGEIKTIRFVKY